VRGALGVAIIGTVFAGIYTNRIDEKLGVLSVPRRERATESIEEARDVVDGAGGPLHDQLIARVDDAYDVAARAGFGVCVGVLLVAAALAAGALAPERLVKVQAESAATPESSRTPRPRSAGGGYWAAMSQERHDDLAAVTRERSLMKRLAVLAAVAVTASIVAAVLATGGSAQPGSRTLTFTERSKGETFRFIDLPPRSGLRRGPPTRISPGDEFVFGNTLLDSAGRRAGRIEGHCKALRAGRRFERVRFGCFAHARLTGGTLSLTIDLTLIQGPLRGEVTGGSGAYEGANGSFTSRGERPTVDTFHIVTF
jgi:hypothetical protein